MKEPLMKIGAWGLNKKIMLIKLILIYLLSIIIHYFKNVIESAIKLNSTKPIIILI